MVCGQYLVAKLPLPSALVVRSLALCSGRPYSRARAHIAANDSVPNDVVHGTTEAASAGIAALKSGSIVQHEILNQQQAETQQVTTDAQATTDAQSAERGEHNALDELLLAPRADAHCDSLPRGVLPVPLDLYAHLVRVLQPHALEISRCCLQNAILQPPSSLVPKTHTAQSSGSHSHLLSM